jgi:hypothetical protein
MNKQPLRPASLSKTQIDLVTNALVDEIVICKDDGQIYIGREDGKFHEPILNIPSLIDNLESESITEGLTANQGKVLKGLVDTLSENLDSLANNRDFEGTFWYGKTTSEFTPPAPTLLAQNYFDFTTNTLYQAIDDDGLKWDNGTPVTTLTAGKSMVYISDSFWDLGQDAGQRGFAYYNADSSWGYAPDRFHSGDGVTIGFNANQEYEVLDESITEDKLSEEVSDKLNNPTGLEEEIDAREGLQTLVGDYIRTAGNGTGFPQDRSLSVLTWTKAVRDDDGNITTPAKFTISPKEGSDYFETSYHGVTFKRQEMSIDIDWTGFRYIVISGNQLISVERPPNLDYEIVAYCYYTPYGLEEGDPFAVSYTDEFVIAADERHQWDRNVVWHQWQHTVGGLGLVNEPTLTIESTIDFRSILHISSPINISDEGLLFNITNGTSEYNPNTPQTLYQSLSPLIAPKIFCVNGVWRELQVTVAPDPDQQITFAGNLVYCDNITGIQQLENNQYAVMWVITSNSHKDPVKLVVGNKPHNDVNSALAEEFTEYNLPFPEMKLLYQLVLGYNSLGFPFVVTYRDLVKEKVSDRWSWISNIKTEDLFHLSEDSRYPTSYKTGSSSSGFDTQTLYYLNIVEPEFFKFKWTATDTTTIEGILTKQRGYTGGNKLWDYHWENEDPATKDKFTALHIYKSISSGSIGFDPYYNGQWWAGVQTLELTPMFVDYVSNEFANANYDKFLLFDSGKNKIYNINSNLLVSPSLDWYKNSKNTKTAIEKVFVLSSASEHYIDIYGVRFKLKKLTSENTWGLYAIKYGEIASGITETGTFKIRYNAYSLYDSSSINVNNTTSANMNGENISSEVRIGSSVRIGYSGGSNFRGDIMVLAEYPSRTYVITLEVVVLCAQMNASGNPKTLVMKITPSSIPYVLGE